ncbi:MAG: primosomal protein N' [Planctomycetes bacterium]|nr:primosomal protein N' [Planctomycetota bacterium]
MTELDLFATPADDAGPEEEAPLFATVAPEVPVPGAFTYRVPPALRERVQVGVRVRVPFGPRAVPGLVLELAPACAVDPRKVRPITQVLEGAPVLDPGVLELARWAAAYYHTPLGEVLAAAVPQDVTARGRPAPRIARLVDPPPGRPARLGAAQRKVLDALAAGPRAADELCQALDVGPDVLRRLEARGLVLLEEAAAPAAPGSDPAPGPAPPELTVEQRLVLGPLLRQVEERQPVVTLLFGITGSGKTEVYLRAIARALELGRGAIVLVPEIALTPQTLARFRARFGDRVAVLHSQLAGEARRGEWRRIRAGEAPVVVGPRSAVWAPVPELGLIVVDEEHETTYKQEHAPRYHARDLAVVRGKQAGVPVLLGSATPSLESWHNATGGRYRLARLRSRPAGSALPRVTVVDMGREWAEVKSPVVLSRVLVREVTAALERGERALLFQNRRGFTTFFMCGACGHVLKCPQCDVTLTLHRAAGAVVCHFCDLRQAPPRGCPACLGPAMRQRGYGTERVEEVVRQLFPAAAVGRLDTDVVREGEPAEVVLDRFRRGEVQVLVGTQMIAKGLDIPEVTVVGVISADTGLALPDFRASERTFQLVAQVAGRAGRGARPGCTVIQTFTPGHFALAAAADHDFERFAREELRARQALDYPPYSRVLKLLLRGPDERKVQDEAVRVVDDVRGACVGQDGVRAVLGPAPSPRAYLTGKFRWQALVKATPEGVRRVIRHLEERRPRGVEWLVDVDPYHVL